MASMRPLGRDRCLELLASVPVGRVVFSMRALPAIRPVRSPGRRQHRRHPQQPGRSAGLRRHAGRWGGGGIRGGHVNLDGQTGWTVVVTGAARLILDEARQARYERLLRPWVDEPMNCVLGIDCDLVTGFELIPAPV